MNLTPLQKRILASIAVRPLLITGGSFRRNLNTIHALFARFGADSLSYAADNRQIAVWDRNNANLARAARILGSAAIIGYEHNVWDRDTDTVTLA